MFTRTQLFPLMATLGVVLFGVATATAAELPASWKADLFAARESAWRGFFGNPDALEALLTDDFVGIDSSGKPWHSKAEAVAGSRTLTADGVRLQAIEFPQNMVQQYGEVAILYSTYTYTTTKGGQVNPTQNGRVTELFRWNGQRWLHTGWHVEANK